MGHGGQPTCAAHLRPFDEALQVLALKATMHVVKIIVLIGQFPQDNHLSTQITLFFLQKFIRNK